MNLTREEILKELKRELYILACDKKLVQQKTKDISKLKDFAYSHDIDLNNLTIKSCTDLIELLEVYNSDAKIKELACSTDLLTVNNELNYELLDNFINLLNIDYNNMSYSDTRNIITILSVINIIQDLKKEALKANEHKY